MTRGGASRARGKAMDSDASALPLPSLLLLLGGLVLLFESLDPDLALIPWLPCMPWLLLLVLLGALLSSSSGSTDTLSAVMSSTSPREESSARESSS
jgi:hypothetical protein